MSVSRDFIYSYSPKPRWPGASPYPKAMLVILHRRTMADPATTTLVFGFHGLLKCPRMTFSDLPSSAEASSQRRSLPRASRRRETGDGRARDRIHQYQHVLAFVAKTFGDRERHIGGLAAHQRPSDVDTTTTER